MAYQPWVKVSGTWQKMTINWAEVIGGPTALSDLSDDSTHRTVTDAEKATWNAGGVDLKPASFDSTASVAITETEANTMPLSNTRVSDSNYSLVTNEVTVTDAGTYFISYSIVYNITDTGGGTRGQTEFWVEADTVAIPQSYSSVYHREASGGSGASAGFIVTLSANDVLRIRGEIINLNTNLNTLRSSFSILKVG